MDTGEPQCQVSNVYEPGPAIEKELRQEQQHVLGKFKLPLFREVTLSYAVPKNLLNRAKIEGLTLMVTGQNLGYISNKMLKLPERTGEQDGAYTIPTQLVFSANLTF